MYWIIGAIEEIICLNGGNKYVGSQRARSKGDKE